MTETSHQPVKRRGHSTVQVGDYLYMWGGDQPGLPHIHNDEKKKSMCSVVEVCHVPNGEWVQKPTTGDPPLGVRGYAVAVIRNEVFFFGGWCCHGDCNHNSLYSFNVETFNWKELSPTTSHHGPMMKEGSSMIAVKVNGEDYLAVIGGWRSSSNNTPPQPGAQYSEATFGANQHCNEVHVYRLKTGEWTSPTVTGDRPPPIDDFTLTSITNTTAILFGGAIDNLRYSNDVYIFEFTDTSVKCTKFPNPGGSAQWPKKREYHSSVLINCSSGPHLLVVGGKGWGASDCWLLNVNKMEWKELTNIPDSVTHRYDHSLSVWNETQTTHWIIEFGGGSKYSDTRFIEIISSTGDLVVQSVLDINEYNQRRVLEGLAKEFIKDHPVSIEDILGKEPKLKDLHRLFDSSAAHYSTIGTALEVAVDDLSHSEKSASDKLLSVFKRWIESNKGVTWRNALQVCKDYPDKFGRVKASLDKFLQSDRAHKEY
ncbi:PREDICTED: kelch domain-containing protein 1-like isoform X2 [Amphimedon queenslandica]|uniref:Death domain-containing protein n=1 Tax=Amphimedon queenslandica TaxID=400682 RepID=A0AAN0JIC2_AMPQE|nr:PREDICTED: kelch domain-containing protein 1-like isoform X2 [Amphimedon queenslandica]|eukprot:XP_019856770.1 PREDICTED: kelch domain-containing protein 1-like isoform X2 [Amphimedon queenslandica]